MHRNITISEGTAESDNNVEIGFTYLDDEWTVVFRSHVDWSQGDLTDWLRNRLDAPMTVSEAIADDRVHVQNMDDELRETEISGFDGEKVARATYDPDAADWTVEILI